jgi:hypothetical protein
MSWLRCSAASHVGSSLQMKEGTVTYDVECSASKGHMKYSPPARRCPRQTSLASATSGRHGPALPAGHRRCRLTVPGAIEQNSQAHLVSSQVRHLCQCGLWQTGGLADQRSSS